MTNLAKNGKNWKVTKCIQATLNYDSEIPKWTIFALGLLFLYFSFQLPKFEFFSETHARDLITGYVGRVVIWLVGPYYLVFFGIYGRFWH